MEGLYNGPEACTKVLWQDSRPLASLCSGFSGYGAKKPLEAAGLMPWYLLFLYFLEFSSFFHS